MTTRLRAVLIAVALLGFIWAQAPQTSASLVWGTSVAHAAPAKADKHLDFAWDGPAARNDGVGDSPLVP